MTPRLVDILLVDDDVMHRALVRAMFRRYKVFNQIHEVEDGESALAFLREPDKPLPALILLDLNMPRMDGRTFLTVVKSDPELKLIPVLVMTSSLDQDDIDRSYLSHCNGCLTKPLGSDALFKIAATLADFWVGLVVLPSPTSKRQVGNGQEQ